MEALSKRIFALEDLTKIKEVLTKVVTLTEAERLLQRQCILTKYECWGLFDGYHSDYRFHCLSGITAAAAPLLGDDKKQHQYSDCFAIGEQLKVEKN